MLFPDHAGSAHSRGQAVDRKLCERTGIFVGDNTGDAPSYGRRVGRKRDAMLKEVAEPLALVRAFSSKHVLECRTDRKTVDCRFSSEEAGLPMVIVVGELAPNIESAPRANQGIDAVVRKARVSVE